MAEDSAPMDDIAVQPASERNGAAADAVDESPARPAKRPAPDSEERSTAIQAACMYCRKSKMKCIRATVDEVCKRCRAAKIPCETRPRHYGNKKAEANQSRSTSRTAAPQRSADPAGQTGDKTNPGYITIPVALLGSQLGQTLSAEVLANWQAPGSGSANMQLSGTELPASSITTPYNVALPAKGQPSGNTEAASSSISTANIPPMPPPAPPVASTSALPSQPDLNHFGITSLSQLAANLTSPAGSEGQESVSYRSNGAMRMDGRNSQQNEHSPHMFTSTPLELLASVGSASYKGKDSNKRSSAVPSFLNPKSSLGRPAEHPSLRPFRGKSRLNLSQTLTDEDYFCELDRPTFTMDEEQDPIYNGILTEEEAVSLFELHWQHLHPLLQVLDRRIDTFHNVRARSTFLFSAVIAIASKFQAGCSATAQRLDKHIQKFISGVVHDGRSTLDVVQAFVVLGPWLDPAPHLTMDPTSTYLTIAFHKFVNLVTPEDTSTPEARLLRRSHERMHMILLSYERGTSLVSGLPYSFQIHDSGVLDHMLEWANAAEATPADHSAVALATIRKDVPEVLRLVSSYGNFSSSQKRPRVGKSPTVIKAIVGGSLDSWLETSLKRTDRPDYIAIVGYHTVLSILCSALVEHIGSPTETEILQQALIAALQTCQAWVGADPAVKPYLGNNTVAMVCYSGCFVLKLLDRWRDQGTPLENSIYKLLSQIATEMETVGSTPVHRFGRSKIYGQRLNRLLQRQVQSRCVTRQGTPIPQGPAVAQSQPQEQEETHETTGGHNLANTTAFQAAGNENAFLAPASRPESAFELRGQSNHMAHLDLNTPFDLSAFLQPESGFDMTALSRDRLDELLPSDGWLPVGTEDLLGFTQEFGHAWNM